LNKLYITILLYLVYQISYGQGNFESENGLFTANYLKGCVGSTITVTPQITTGTYFFCFAGDPTNVGSSNNRNCFNDQANQVDRNSFTYTTPGSYTILAFRQLTNSQEFDSLHIEIIDPQLPSFSTVNCGGTISFELNTVEESFDFYTLDFGDGSTITEYSINAFPINHDYADNNASYAINVTARLDNSGLNNCDNNSLNYTIIPADLQEDEGVISAIRLDSETSFSIDYVLNANQNYYLQLKENFNGSYRNRAFISRQTTGTFTFTALDLANSFYCARIIAVSQCDNSELLSNEVCTILFKPAATGTGNFIDWNSAQFITTILYKNGEAIFTGSAPYLDENVLCGQTDSYYIEAVDENGINQQSFVEDVTAIFGNPTAGIEQISLNTLSDTEVVISWNTPAGLQPEKYIIYKQRPGNGAFFPIDSTRSNDYTDEGIDFTTKIFTYGISYTNSCGGESILQNEASNILLDLSMTDNTISLKWNGYTGYAALFDRYIVQQYDAQMNLINSYNVTDTTFTLNTAMSDIQKFNFQVEAYSTSGAISYSNIISYKIPTTFFVPTAFSPDGNGLNEEIRILGKFIDQVEFSIYNRWGNLMFKSSELGIGWDGYLQNREAPEGTYSYIVTVVDQYNETYTKSGVFNLIR
jgi:gliding motility-associated-like protein